MLLRFTPNFELPGELTLELVFEVVSSATTLCTAGKARKYQHLRLVSLCRLGKLTVRRDRVMLQRCLLLVPQENREEEKLQGRESASMLSTFLSPRLRYNSKFDTVVSVL